jgi:hypothetical protein
MLVKIAPEIGNTFQSDVRDIDDIGRSITASQDIVFFRKLQHLRSNALTYFEVQFFKVKKYHPIVTFSQLQ